MDQQQSLVVQACVEGTVLRPRLRVILAAPRGFCAGVRRAIEGVEMALERYGAPVYVRRPIVHNLAVVRDLEAKGAVFVEELDEVRTAALSSCRRTASRRKLATRRTAVRSSGSTRSAPLSPKFIAKSLVITATAGTSS